MRGLVEVGVYLISARRQTRVEAEPRLEEMATWTKNRLTRDFELVRDPYGSATVGDPHEMLDNFISGGRENYGRFSDPVVDALYQQ